MTLEKSFPERKSKMRAVFDLDDTICISRNRDYENAIPVSHVIQKMKAMKDDGWEIVIYSSRGQVSCKGDIALIEQKNRKTAENWLKRNNVPYDQLIFGKPIADVYVDDKGMSVNDFGKAEIGLLYGGGSRSKIYRIGNVVKKYFGSDEDVRRFKEWIDDNLGSCRFPHVISYLYDSVYMDYIEGVRLVDDCKWEDIEEILSVIRRFERMPTSEFTIGPQLQILEKNKSGSKEWDETIDRVKDFLVSNEQNFAQHASYCHGDLILSNVLKSKEGLYFIDSRYFRESSSYLFDLAKLRMSLMDYERLFGLSIGSNHKHLRKFDEQLAPEIKPLVIGLMLMYLCRLYRYKDENGKEIVKRLVDGVIKENEWIFE